MLAVALLGGLKAVPQDSSHADEDFKIWLDHPRLLLRPQRLRLLKRERERESMRWSRFDALVRGAGFPEPGFAFALYYAVTGDRAVGEKALSWALAGSDLRQLALVYDWCQAIMTDTQRQQLASRIIRLMRQRTGDDISAARDRTLAAVAVADDSGSASEATLAAIVRQWWRAGVAPRLAHGDLIIAHADLYPLDEMLHAIRDNLRIDLRADVGDYFARLPLYELSSYYPAPFQEGSFEYYLPAFSGQGEPDLKRAAMARAAELSLVAYDANDRQLQYVQGWLMQDRFMLADPLGAPYEYLWGNPYQPGLSFMQLPVTCYDPLSGALFLRSSWDEDASWFGIVGSEMQLFEGGRVTVLSRRASGVAAKPLIIGPAQVVLGRNRVSFAAAGEATYVVGLPPNSPWLVEIDDEEMQQVRTDRAGSLALQFPKDIPLHALVHE